MENKLPKFLKYDLEGYRGFGVTKFPLTFIEVGNKVIGSYCNGKVGHALATEIGNTKEEVVDMLFKTLKTDRRLYGTWETDNRWLQRMLSILTLKKIPILFGYFKRKL